MPKQKSVVGLGDLTKLPLIYWSLLFIIASLFTSTTAQTITDVQLVEANDGVVRINTNIVFTCTFKTTVSVAAVNLEYGDPNIVCLSYDQGVIKVNNRCAAPKVTQVEKVSETMFRFTINDAQLADELTFKCKAYNSFSDQVQSNTKKITVEVPPEEPVMTLAPSDPAATPANMVVGETWVITCTVNTGKPGGQVFWYKTDSTPGAQEEALNAETTSNSVQQNATVVVTETLQPITLGIAHNGAKYRCASRNNAIKLNEAPPSTEITLDVKYGVTAVTLTPSNVAGQTVDNVPYFYPGVDAKIVCVANGNPAPTLGWTKLTGDNDLQSVADTLIIGENAALGDYSYQCSARNDVNGATKEVVEEYKLSVRAKPTEPPRPTEPVTIKPTIPGDTAPSTGSLNTAGLAGGLAGAVIAILIIVAIVFCVCRRKKKGMLDEDAEQGKQTKSQGFDNGPAGGFDVELDDNQPYDNYPKTNGGAFPIDTVDNTPGSRRGFHVPADPNYDPAYM